MRSVRLLAALLFSNALPAQVELISGDRIGAHVRFLASDLLEGRGVGSRGDGLTTEYLAAAFAAAGARPAGDVVNGRRTYFQRVPLMGVTTLPSAAIANLKYLDDFVGATMRQTETPEFEAETVFLGHGITAPEFGWDDYQGPDGKPVDVKGKIVVAFTNEPPSEDPKFFGGKALTYYGRWVYKFQEATRRGARAAILIHTPGTAGYGWEVVRNSWGKEDPQVPVKAGEHALDFAGWMTADAARAVFGRDLDALLKQADTRGFKPHALGTKLRIHAPATFRLIETRNVVAMVEGSDERLKEEAVIYSAHWDHLGVDAKITGDGIYNGAIDNGTGLGMILELARAWASLPQKPRRTALFLAVTAEESGLRGSEFYARNPVFPAGRTQLNLNFDAVPPYGQVRDLVAIGAERTTAYPLLEEAAARFGFAISPDPRPEQGSYYRSDHFSFARVGVPAFSLNLGMEYEGPRAAEGLARAREYGAKRYHQPSDEFDETWDWSSVERLARLGLTLGLNAANAPRTFTWRPGDEFLAARQASLARPAGAK